MLDVVETEYRRQTGWTRRQLLRAGFLGLGGLSLADLFRLRASATAPAAKRANAVILLWAGGGLSHLETYDLKPDSPAEMRGPFRPMKTRVPGLDICELLPEHARIAHRFTLLRSLAHEEADHGYGHHRFLSGYRDNMPGNDNSGPSYYPAIEAAVGRSLGGSRTGVPAAIAVIPRNGSIRYRGAGFWGSKYEVPLVMKPAEGLPNTGLAIEASRFEGRRELLDQLDGLRRRLGASGALDGMDKFQRLAHEVILSGEVHRAFNLGLESPALRARYGQGWGERTLLARRLVEAGVGFVNVDFLDKPTGEKSVAGNWDDHAVNWDMRRAMEERLPAFDRAVATLIEDIHERGLAERVLVIVAGEFGRTPLLEFKDGRIGRGHWPHAMSVLVAGGRRARGDVIGRTDSRGAYPKTCRYDPRDLHATIYQHLGIDPGREYLDPTGRPLPLTRGTAIAGLL